MTGVQTCALPICFPVTILQYSWFLNKDFTDVNVTDLKPLPRTIDDIQEGDVVVDEGGDERKVLGVCGKVYLMSGICDFSKYSNGFTIEELKTRGYKPKDEPEPEIEEMTLAEVCKELGREVKIKK